MKERAKVKRQARDAKTQLPPLIKQKDDTIDEAIAELRDCFQRLCCSGDTMPTLPHPSIALSSALMEHGKAYWRRVALRVVSQLKAMSSDEVVVGTPRLHTARLLLLYYMSCDAWCGPMLSLEGVVPMLVRECIRYHATCLSSSATAAAVQDPNGSPRGLIPLGETSPDFQLLPRLSTLDVPVDWFRYTHRALCLELLRHDQMDFVVPIGAQSMLCLLTKSPLPQSEVDEYDAVHATSTTRHDATSPMSISKLPISSSIFTFSHSDSRQQDDPQTSFIDSTEQDRLLGHVASNPSFHIHLVVRTLTCIMSTARGLERRRLLADGAAHALALLATSSHVPDQCDTVRYPPVLERLLSLSFVRQMAHAGLAAISTDELHRLVVDSHDPIALLSSPCRHHHHPSSVLLTHDKLDTIVGHRSDALKRHAADARRRVQVDACVRNPANSIEARLRAVTSFSSSSVPQPPLQKTKFAKADVISWVRHADAVTRHLLHSLAVLHEAATMSGGPSSSLKCWLAQADRARGEAAGIVARQVRELECMALQDKPPETEIERKARLQAKAQALAIRAEEKRLADELHVRRLRDAKAEQEARLDMTREDRYVPLHIQTDQEREAAAVAVEAARVAALRVLVRERRLQDVEEWHMREQDALARQVRRYQWDLDEAAFRVARQREADESHHMHAEDVYGHRTWPLVDAAQEEADFRAKLAAKKAERAAVRRARRQAQHPALYAKEWEVVTLDDGGSYFRNIVTGDVQWTDPSAPTTTTTAATAAAWEPTVDDVGRTYYVNTATGETAWTTPEGAAMEGKVQVDEWDEFTTDDGVAYYVHRTTGDSVWEKPVAS
ncbi:hypothetical protein DYB38_007974 [Aphanomyces astaci]|uniref:WW domain-containing protein n=3 Tax=Aphanomyces astaci TaxID=112090 RepID=A0A397FE23_APHAT|nr:hypothetical protein DYB38_007974 [Aphanomyces astaci]RHZ29189.1 hypothetical protein DYB31_010691 [Aphanomyces astaci]